MLMTPSTCWMRALSLMLKWFSQKMASNAAAPMTVANVIENGPKSTDQSTLGNHCVCT
jgi:hypothetical protein